MKVIDRRQSTETVETDPPPTDTHTAGSGLTWLLQHRAQRLLKPTLHPLIYTQQGQDWLDYFNTEHRDCWNRPSTRWYIQAHRQICIHLLNKINIVGQGELEAWRAKPGGGVLRRAISSPHTRYGPGKRSKLPSWGPVQSPPRVLMHFLFFSWALLQSCYSKLCAVLRVGEKQMPGRHKPLLSSYPCPFLPSSTAGYRLHNWMGQHSPPFCSPSLFPLPSLLLLFFSPLSPQK